MQDPDDAELRRRLELLVPFLGAVGRRTLETYVAAGVLAALPDLSFPVADARFHRTAGGLTFHAHGPVYFTLTRAGELQFGPGSGVPIADAIMRYVQLTREKELEDTGPEENPTEEFPPPRLVLDADSSRLYIAAVRGHHGLNAQPRFIPVEQYIEDRAQLFIEAFRSAP